MNKVFFGDCRETLRKLAADGVTVQTCVTSPPYFGLRDYGVEGQIGLEPTPEEYIAKMVEVFREVRRVLADDGTLWLNIGDSFGKGKQLLGIPWMLAFALRADGWYLRQDIIWAKPNPMPESVRDRCTKAHEYIFMLTKSRRYYYDADAISELASTEDMRRPFAPGQVDSRGNGHDRGGGQIRTSYKQRGHSRRHAGFNDRWDAMERSGQCSSKGNKRSVWTVTTQPFKDAHFATFPPALIEPCIKAGCPAGGTVLDPFGGAGTTGLVADRLGRNAILIELNPEYAAMAERRIANEAGIFASVEAVNF